MTEIENVKAKIRKLFALAKDSGATEQEASTAMSMAMGLMAKHGIEQNALGVEKPKVSMKRTTEAARDYELTIAMAAGVLYGCKVIQHSWGGKNCGFTFIGRTDNIDASEMTMLWLVSQVESFYKQALPRGLSQPQRAEFRRTFKNACANRVYLRAVALINDPAAAASTGSTALVVSGYFKALAVENDDFISQQYGADLRTRMTRRKGGSGTMAGHTAGNNVQLHRQVRT